MASTSTAHIHSSATRNDCKPEWYFEKGLRKVKPYVFQYSTFAKERWRGRSVIDVFSSDFRDRSPEYYARAVASGVIKINGQKITEDVIIRNGDLITNTLHRHEPPVTGDPVRILHRDDARGLLVVEKPGSMPIHPTGRYNYNTLLSILKFDYDLPLVHSKHVDDRGYCLGVLIKACFGAHKASNRLDRLTSGVMICALTTEASRGLSVCFGQEGAVRKEYLARCRGQFPDGEILCEEPMLTIDRQVGLNVVHPEGKHAKTYFKKMSYDSETDSSVVHCRPVTGRSHQIRVHLQFLGYPILNDVIYCRNSAWGPAGGRGGIFPHSAEEKVATEKLEDHELSSVAGGAPASPLGCEEKPSGTEVAVESGKARARPKRPASAVKLGRNQRQGISQVVGEKRARLDPEMADSGNCSGIAFNEVARAVVKELRKARDIEDGFGREKDTICIDRAFKTPEELQARVEDPAGLSSGQGLGEFCGECGVPLLPDPMPEQLFIYLHAFRYQTDTWDFSSGLPWWADDEQWHLRRPRH